MVEQRSPTEQVRGFLFFPSQAPICVGLSFLSASGSIRLRPTPRRTHFQWVTWKQKATNQPNKNTKKTDQKPNTTDPKKKKRTKNSHRTGGPLEPPSHVSLREIRGAVGDHVGVARRKELQRGWPLLRLLAGADGCVAGDPVLRF